MSNSQIDQAREAYNIDHWSDGFFQINAAGQVCVSSGISLVDIVNAAKAEGLQLPLLVRFDDILLKRCHDLRAGFAEAMKHHDYKGAYQAVYPIKVNQQASVVQTIVSQDFVGLEVGSKSELLAALALNAEKTTPLICNGYKDREFIRLALIARRMGQACFIIIEKPAELALIVEEAARLDVRPLLGMRMRLASIGKGKWQNTGGEKAKFGLTLAQVLQLISDLKASQHLDCLQLLHFHLGSQIANIDDIRLGMREAAQHYAELRKMNVPITCLDVGGGLGVDYEGTRSRHFCSMNYGMNEYANNIVQVLTDICTRHDLPQPDIITESGRAMTAHHAVLITNIIDVETAKVDEHLVQPQENESLSVQALRQVLQDLPQHSVTESYHAAKHGLEEAQASYQLGLVSLEERARVEAVYLQVVIALRQYLKPAKRHHREILDELNDKLAARYFANFSLFQSLPDAWAIDQIFPLMPLSGLDQPLSARARICDITCDSDGQIDHYVDKDGIQSTLAVPAYDKNNPYLLGIFLVGAYQEILGDMHNLFGDTHAVHVKMSAQGFSISQSDRGDTVADVLCAVKFDVDHLITVYHQQLQHTPLSEVEKENLLSELTAGLAAYTYYL